jgi:ATP-dependent 26S proteasome regulatory subunit
LNIGDGFLGEHLKLHVIATTNAPMRRLDEAVQRPGRLMGSREFRRLTRAEALRLAQAKGLKLADGSDSWSLAEVYNGKPEVLAPESSVGFSPS